MDAINTINLTKAYADVTAVDRLNLTVKAGELFSLLGVNGAGKTTAIKMLTCLTAPTSGDALLLGHSVVTSPEAVKSLIALSPQETAVAPNLSVRENLELMAGAHGFSRQKMNAATEDMIARFGLAEVRNKRAGKLSGGWQRRLSIAMALICEPKILFLDEPTLGLDVIARSQLWDTIRALKGQITIILTTHYLQEAEALSDRTGIMCRGKLLTVGTPQEITAQAKTATFEEAFIQIVREAET